MIRARDTLRLSLCLVLAFGLAACSGGDDGTGPDDNGQGSFTANVTGPITGSFSGFAWHSGTIVDPETEQRGWVLFLGSDASTSSSVYIVRLGDRPGSGSYSFIDLSGSEDLANNQFGGIVTVSLPGGLVFSGFTSGGTLTITSSSDQRVEGSFNLQITGFDQVTQQEVTASVSGNFSAVSNAFAFPGL